MPTCDKCSKYFPLAPMIDGKRRNLSKRRFCLECSPFGTLNRKDLTKYEDGKRTCGTCRQLLDNSHFYPKLKDGDVVRTYHSECRSCARARQRLVKQNLQRQAVEYKGGRCERCGYNRCSAALEFHHRDPKQKDFQISNVKTLTITDKLRAELDKCDLLCANCHREHHYNSAH